MRTIGIILLLIGVVMLIFRGVSFTTEEKVAELGPIELNKKEKKRIDWPMYAGGLATAAGLVLMMADRKKN